jgi:hypothetical protein
MTSERKARMARGTRSGWRLIVTGAVALALIGTGATQAATGRPTAPPDTTFEVAIDSGSVVAPGGTISFHGTCWVSGVGAMHEVRVRGMRDAPDGSGIEPFDFAIWVTVNSSTGEFSGTLAVPDDAPNGRYVLRTVCLTQDQVYGYGAQPFTIDGPLITTTTMTTATSTPLHIEPVPAEPPPAVVVHGRAELTG